MSPPSDSIQPKKPSAAGRYFFLLLVGLVIGAVCTTMLLRTLDSRKTPVDRWPDAVMNVMAVHSGKLDGSIKANRCAATELLPHLQALRTMANDLEPAFPGLADDQRFKDHASKFRASLDTALSSPPLNCAGAGTTLQSVGETCKACHQDFRG